MYKNEFSKFIISINFTIIYENWLWFMQILHMKGAYHVFPFNYPADFSTYFNNMKFSKQKKKHKKKENY